MGKREIKNEGLVDGALEWGIESQMDSINQHLPGEVKRGLHAIDPKNIVKVTPPILDPVRAVKKIPHVDRRVSLPKGIARLTGRELDNMIDWMHRVNKNGLFDNDIKKLRDKRVGMKEDITLNELSNKTLLSYISKAVKERDVWRHAQPLKKYKLNHKKIHKMARREKGFDTAHKKLVDRGVFKEEKISLSELSKYTLASYGLRAFADGIKHVDILDNLPKTIKIPDGMRKRLVRMARNRTVGYTVAMRKFKGDPPGSLKKMYKITSKQLGLESVDYLNEISKALMGRYLERGVPELKHYVHKLDGLDARAAKGFAVSSQTVEKAFRKTINLSKGVSTAWMRIRGATPGQAKIRLQNGGPISTKKSVHEDVNTYLNEVSKGRLFGYLVRARSQLPKLMKTADSYAARHNKGWVVPEKETNTAFRKLSNRYTGAHVALSKIVGAKPGKTVRKLADQPYSDPMQVGTEMNLINDVRHKNKKRFNQVAKTDVDKAKDWDNNMGEEVVKKNLNELNPGTLAKYLVKSERAFRQSGEAKRGVGISRAMKSIRAQTEDNKYDDTKDYLCEISAKLAARYLVRRGAIFVDSRKKHIQFPSQQFTYLEKDAEYARQRALARGHATVREKDLVRVHKKTTNATNHALRKLHDKYATPQRGGEGVGGVRDALLSAEKERLDHAILVGKSPTISMQIKKYKHHSTEAPVIPQQPGRVQSRYQSKYTRPKYLPPSPVSPPKPKVGGEDTLSLKKKPGDVKEEIDLNELSKTLLIRYLGRAIRDSNGIAFSRDSLNVRKIARKPRGVKQILAKSLNKRVRIRNVGINRAMDRLDMPKNTLHRVAFQYAHLKHDGAPLSNGYKRLGLKEEEETLDEISKLKAAFHIAKASADVNKRGFGVVKRFFSGIRDAGTKPIITKTDRVKAVARQKGVARAQLIVGRKSDEVPRRGAAKAYMNHATDPDAHTLLPPRQKLYKKKGNY